MTRASKFIIQFLSGSSDQNIEFEELKNLLIRTGFKLRIKGSHHIFFKEGIPEIINLQPKGKMAKPYQIKQVRTLLIQYKLVQL